MGLKGEPHGRTLRQLRICGSMASAIQRCTEESAASRAGDTNMRARAIILSSISVFLPLASEGVGSSLSLSHEILVEGTTCCFDPKCGFAIGINFVDLRFPK